MIFRPVLVCCVSVRICSVSDTLRKKPSVAAVLIYPAWPVWYRVQTGAACPGVRACVLCLAWSALHLARSVLPPVVFRRFGCAGMAGVHRRGIQGTPGVGQVSPVSSDQNKKGTFFAITHPIFTKRHLSDCASLQIFRKIQKDPSPGLICAILDRKKGAL